MNKLKLHIADLRVETFETLVEAWPGVGTVHARKGADDGGLPLPNADTDASNCRTCDTCQGPNCCGCADSTAA